MATTTGAPWNIAYPVVGDAISPLHPVFGALATSVHNAMNSLGRDAGGYRVASAAARDAIFTSPVIGNTVFRTDTNLTERYNGSAWKPWDSDWIAYTPSSSTITAGAGTTVTRYRYENGRIRCHIRYTIGSGGNITGTLSVALPVTRAALSHAYEMSSEIGNVYDTSLTTNYIVTVIANATSTTQVVFGYGTPNITAFVTSAVPFTLAAGDVYEANFLYDPA